MKILNNFVLVKLDTHYNKVLSLDGKTVILQFLDTYFEPEHHEPTSGIIMHVPEKLVYTRRIAGSRDSKALKYDTGIELQAGDRGIWHYLSVRNAKELNQQVDGMVAIRYDNIYLRIRNDKVEGINGFIIVEPLDEIIQSTLYIPPHLRKQKSISKGIVRYISAPVREYRDFYFLGPDADDLQVGDTVVFEKFNAISLQYSMHQVIDRGKQLYRMQRRDIICKIKNTAAAA